MSGGNEARGRKALIEQLAGDLQALGAAAMLRIAELDADGVRPWVVRRDKAGTPGARQGTAVPWDAMHSDGVLSEQDFHEAAAAETDQPFSYVCTAPDVPFALQALEWIRAAYPERAAFSCQEPLGGLLADVIADDPLTRWYELVVLRSSKSGRLLLGGHQLFPPRATRGDTVKFQIRCAESDIDGTAFAVVAAESGQRSFQLISIESVKLTPGHYQIIAELRGPGAVRFHVRGEQADFAEDPRSWRTLTSLVPERLQRVAPTHLICLIEISGVADAIRERIGRAKTLIKTAAANAEGRLAITAVSYGSHPVRRLATDEPPQILGWAVTSEDALTKLERLERMTERNPPELGYPRAAELECALAALARRLNDQLGRPVVVTIGRRPAFPPRVDASEVIPCPKRQDWQAALKRLRQVPGATFGAIRDGEPDDEEVWEMLGSDARASAASFDDQTFAVGLGLTSLTPQLFPFPLLADES